VDTAIELDETRILAQSNDQTASAAADSTQDQ